MLLRALFRISVLFVRDGVRSLLSAGSVGVERAAGEVRARLAFSLVNVERN